jgi:MFS family permease
MGRDAHRIFGAQAARAFAYGLGAVLLGTTLERRGISALEVSGVLAAVVAGTALCSLAVASVGDRWGRRRIYALLYMLLGVTGVVYATSRTVWLLICVSLLGAMSTDVVESGPFTSLEQAMLATDLVQPKRLRGFGTYNAVATVAGSLGALAAAGPALLARVWTGAPSAQRWFFLFVPAALVGAVLAQRLSRKVETAGAPPAPGATTSTRPRRLGSSRAIVEQLSALFAMDSFGGGFVVQSFIAYWLARRFGASTATVGAVFFAVGLIQALSFLTAARLGERFGMLKVMVFSHFPSNLFLIAVGFAPNLAVAVVLLLARTVLSQMDVPVRQNYVMTLVEPEAQTAAAAYTNTVRYLTRPFGTVLSGVAASATLGLPFVIGGVVKGGYDVALWLRFRRVPLSQESTSR